MQECFADVNGVRLCFETLGDPADPPLLLVMGLGGHMIWWEDEFCQALVERGFRVIRFDNRDVGRSTRLTGRGRVVRSYLRRDPQQPYTLDDMADDAAALLDHLEVSAADVVGVSMGGMIAQTLAIRHPARVRSLTSMSSTTGSKRVGWTAPRVLVRMFAKRPAGEAAYIAWSLDGFRRIGSPRYFESNSERQRARALATFGRGLNPAGVMRQLAAIVAAPDRTPQLRELRIPACVIHGTADPLVHVSGGKATARAIPEAELILIPGMGHDLPVELWPVLLDGIERAALRGRTGAAGSRGGRRAGVAAD